MNGLLYIEIMKYHRFEFDAILTKKVVNRVSKLKVVNFNWILFPVGTTTVTYWHFLS
jgi:hypothetical protein